MPTAVPLSQMVDLALGTPELGAVNFNVLHTLLHAMITKLNIQDAKAEINDHDREFLQGTAKRVGSALHSDRDSTRGDDSLLDDTMSEVSFVPRKPASVPYHMLENRVAELAKQLEDLNALPTTQELIDRAQQKSEKSVLPVSEMWQGMQLKKRVDANEDGVSKLMLMMGDLMKEMGALKEANDKLQDQIGGLDLDDLNKRLKSLEDLQRDMNLKLALLPAPEEFDSFVRWQQLEEAMLGIRSALDDLQKPVERIVMESFSQTDAKPESRPTSSRSRPSSSLSGGPSPELLEILERLGHLSSDFGELMKRVKSLETEMPNKLDKSALDGLNLSDDILNQLNKLKDDIHKLQSGLAKLNELSGGDEELKAQLEELLKRVQEDEEAVNRLRQMLLQLEKEVEKLNKTTHELTEDNLNKKKKIEELFALCEELERRKADKEYVAMEVDVKADKRQLEGKVNHSLFDSTTSEINKTIKDILDKLSGNDAEWKSMLAKLANDLDGKLDRLELTPLKEWLEAKLKALSKKIQDGQLNWTEDEAAGLRRQLIQRYHCLSCDKPVDVMPKGPQPALPAGYGLPATRSPRPYTTYELDQIRQHARSFGTPDVADFYATTRQCGGSHTLTYPNKRLTRMNNFNHLFTEEEPEPLRMYKEEVDVLGADGHIYKGRMDATGRLEAKIPSPLAQNRQNNAPQSQTPRSGQRPMSARGPQVRRSVTPQRPGSRQEVSRPQSARPSSSNPDQRSGHTTPQPSEEHVYPEGEEETGEITVEVPSQIPVANAE